MLKKIVRFSAILAVIMTSILIISPAYAADTRSGESVSVPAGETVNDDLYLTGAEITVDGIVNGNIIAAGNKITVNGEVNGSIIAVGQTVAINGRVRNSVRAACSTMTIEGTIGHDIVAVAGFVSTTSGSTIGRDLLVYSGVVNIKGPVSRNIRGNIGRLTINNRVGGYVDVEVGNLKLERSADIAGHLTYVSENKAVIEAGAHVNGEIAHKPPEKKDLWQIIGGIIPALLGFMAVMAVVCLVLQYSMALLTGIIMILLIRKYIPGLVDTLKNKPWHCLGWGAIKFFLVPAAVIIVCATVVGIPLGLIALALYLIAVYLSPLLVAIFLGKWMLKQPSGVDSTGRLIGALALGLLVIQFLDVVPGIGFFTGLASILFGLGMMVGYFKDKLGK